MGRASSYTPELAAEVCDRLEAGESLRAICRDLHMPAESVVRGWAFDDVQGFAARYTQARDRGLEYMADELFAISDDGTNDFVEQQIADGVTVIRPDKEHIARSRLRVDTRKWYLSKLAPKRYGDRIAHEHSGPDGGPIKQEVTDERRAALTLALLSAIGSPLLGQRTAGQPDMGSGAEEPPAA